MKMPKEGIKTDLFAPCGMNCGVCYRHCLHPKPCGGCLADEGEKPAHCRKCAIKSCVREKFVSYCYECPRYPCKQIDALEKSYRLHYETSLRENSLFVQKWGLSEFMEDQRQKYACPICGGVISLHDKVCSECGKKCE